jgi:hypothetical protein
MMAQPIDVEYLDFLLISIEAKLVALQWMTIERQGNRRSAIVHEARVIDWAITCCIAGGWPEPILLAVLEKTTPDKRWWKLRTLLPTKALYTLSGHLEAAQDSNE